MTAFPSTATKLQTAGKALLNGLRRGFALNHLAGALLSATVATSMLIAPSADARLLDQLVAEASRPISNPALDALRSVDVTEKTITVQAGDTLLSLYGRLGINDPEVLKLIRHQPDMRPFVVPQTGQLVSAGLFDDGRVAYLRMYLEGPHDKDNRILEISRNGKQLTASSQPFVFDTVEEMASGKVVGSLERTAEALDIPDNVLEQLRNVWEGSTDPVAQLKRGDFIQVSYERKYADGHFIRNAQLLGVRITHDNKTQEAIWLPELKNFYTPSGESVRQTFIRTPLEVVEVSSEFSPMRRNPVTGRLRPHYGTDFRAPQGTPIYAAANGVVAQVAFQRRGYGRYVKLDHGMNRETVYAHMSAIAKGLTEGQQVKRGQVIGYVGRTGLATGNHLHYELVIDGVQVNPLTADLPDTGNLTSTQLAQLKSISKPMMDRFTMLARGDSGLVNKQQSVVNTAALEDFKSDFSFRSSLPARAMVRTHLAQKRSDASNDNIR